MENLVGVSDICNKFDKLVALRKEQREIKKRIKQIGQEEAKIYGDTIKYNDK